MLLGYLQVLYFYLQQGVKSVDCLCRRRLPVKLLQAGHGLLWIGQLIQQLSHSLFANKGE
ncbi:hypothetical protein LGKMAHEF_04311 [Aeromonas salmonicida]|nr:hypothetical protein ASA01S_002_00430 [Aeromonas salmonicida subsp. masoucida NBRC 13784]